MKTEHDAVNQPQHYTDGGIETIDFLRAKLTPAEFRGYCKGTALVYLARAGKKDGNAEAQDAAKAAWYAQWLAGIDPRRQAGRPSGHENS